jgi:hypothetical protein
MVLQPSRRNRRVSRFQRAGRRPRCSAGRQANPYGFFSVQYAMSSLNENDGDTLVFPEGPTRSRCRTFFRGADSYRVSARSPEASRELAAQNVSDRRWDRACLDRARVADEPSPFIDTRCRSEPVRRSGGDRMSPRLRPLTAGVPKPTATDRVRCPNRDNRASCRADNSAETAGRCGAADALWGRKAPALETS